MLVEFQRHLTTKEKRMPFEWIETIPNTYKFLGEVSMHDITISKKGLKMYCQNTISIPLDVRLK